MPRQLGLPLLLSLLLTVPITAQRHNLPPGSDDYVLKTWTVEDGLPESSPTAITQTPDGYLWVGTWNGLARFDGLRFTAYHSGNTPAFRVSRINALFAEDQGALWIATAGGGLIRHHRGSFRRFGVEDGLTGLSVNACARDAKGTLWAATNDGLFFMKDERFVRVSVPTEAEDKEILDIDADSSGGLWLSASEKVYELTTQDDSVCVRRTFNSAGVVVDSRKRVWLWDRSTLHRRFDPNGDAIFDQFGAWSHTSTWPLLRGGIGVCFVDRIVLIVDGRITQITHGGGAALRANECLFQDREGNLWLGRASSGLTRFRKKSLTVLTATEGLSSEITASVSEDGVGRLFVGTFRHGLNVRQGLRFSSVVLPGVESHTTINLLWKDRRNTVWVGPTAGGLVRISGRNAERYERGLVTPLTSVTAIAQDDSGTLWIGTRWDGVQHDMRGQVTVWDTGRGLSSNEIVALLRAKNGDIWVGTSFRGVNRISNDRVTDLTADDGLTSNEVRSIIEDEDGAVWITTRRGLNRWKNGKLRGLGEKDGLADEAISSMIDDGRGNYWFGGIKGIFWTEKRDLNRLADGEIGHIRSRAFGTEDGLIVSEVGGGGHPLVWKDRKGLLWFTSERGLICIDPSSVDENPVPPPVIVEDVRVEHQPVAFGQPVVLQPEQSKVEFFYTGISFRSPGKVQFRYRMEGFEDEWQEAGNRRFVQYTHLPPGDYVFHVTAANSDGLWNETGTTVALVVLPPFYRTWWFAVLAVLFILTSGPTVYWLRVAALKREHRRQQEFGRKLIERQEDERQRISRDMHDSLGQELLVLKHRIQARLRKKKIARETSILLDELSDTVSGTITLVRHISHNLRPPELDRLGLTETIKAILERIRTAQVFELRGMIDDLDGCFEKEDEINVVRILQEALNNVIKHSRASRVHVTVMVQGDSVEVVVRDDGRGIDLAHGAAGGLGLADMRERARLMNGSCTLELAENGGTIVRILLPKKNAHGK